MAPELSNLYTCPLELFEHPSCRLHTLASDLKHSTPNRLPLFFFCSLCHSRRNKWDVYSHWSKVCASGLCWTSTGWNSCPVVHAQLSLVDNPGRGNLTGSNYCSWKLVTGFLTELTCAMYSIIKVLKRSMRPRRAFIVLMLVYVALFILHWFQTYGTCPWKTRRQVSMLNSHWLQACIPGSCSSLIGWNPVARGHAQLPLVESLSPRTMLISH